MKKMLSLLFCAVFIFVLSSCNKAVSFDVNFVVDGEIYGTVGTSGNEAISMPLNPTKEGYLFDGWFWDEGKWQRPFTATSLLNEPLSSDMSVYAKWIEINVEPEQPNTDINSSVLEVNGEKATATVPNATTTFSFLNDIKVADGASYILANDIGCQNVIASKTVALEEGDNTYYLLVTNDTAQKLYTVTIRRRPIYTVEFNTNGGTTVETLYIEEDNTVDTQETSKTGYIFDGWALNNELVSFPYTVKDNIIFNAIYTPISYEIVYNLNGGVGENFVNTYTIEQTVTLGTPIKEGYDFAGWYSNETFESSRITKIIKGNTERKVFYAKWTPARYYIQYKLDGGTNDSLNPSYFTVENEIVLVSPRKHGYTFAGWYADSGFNDEIKIIEKNSIGNRTLYAKWIIIEYSIECKLNEVSDDVSIPSTYTIENLPLALPSVYGNREIFWYTDVSFENKIEEINSLGDLTLHAKLGGIVFVEKPTYIEVVDYDGADTEVVIPSTFKNKPVTSIGASAFSGCKHLKNVKIGNNVTDIGDYAFYRCDNLESIIIPESVIKIGSYAFYKNNRIDIYFEASSSPTSLGSNWINSIYYYIYFYRENKPTYSEKYWHYVDGEVVIWR